MEEYGERVYTTKIIFLGENDVGKSTILANIIYNKTVLPKGMYAFYKTFNKNDGSGELLKINFWDTAHQENYNNIVPMFYKNAQAAILVFDLGNRSSFEKLNEIMQKVREFAHPSIIIFLVGNKTDLEIQGNRVITREEAVKYAESIEAFYNEVSALQKQGIDDLVDLIVSKIPKPSQDNQVFRVERNQPLQMNFCTRVVCGAR